MTHAVLISGATRGLGLAIATHLLEQGWAVAGAARSTSADFDALMTAYPDRASFHAIDLADHKAIPALVKAAEAAHGPLFALVNNAAVGLGGILATQHQADIDTMLAVNLGGAITLTKYAVRGMMARREGRIVTISSIGATTGYHAMAVYAATKAGLQGFSRALAREVGKRGITVNCVAPGFLDTAMTAGYDAQTRERIDRRAPLGLPGMEEVAQAVSYLLSPAAARVTGTVMTIDGGSSI